MSYDLHMYYKPCVHCGVSRPVEVEHFEEGGTQQVGGTSLADLNVTWNYSKYYYAHLDEEKGLRWLYGKTGGECAPRLRLAIDSLNPNDISVDYWEPTEGNARKPLERLLKWCEQHPEAIFDGD